MAYHVVYNTCPDQETAESLAALLVEQHLAACVSIIPGVISVYRWQGKTEKGAEWLLMAKSRADRFDALRAAIVAHHPYELPEIIAVPLDAGHLPYLDWIDRETTDSK